MLIPSTRSIVAVDAIRTVRVAPRSSVIVVSTVIKVAHESCPVEDELRPGLKVNVEAEAAAPLIIEERGIVWEEATNLMI